MKRKLLVTGTSGYVGQQLIRQLVKNLSYTLLLLQSVKSPKLFEPNKRIKYFYYDSPDFNLYSCLLDEKPDVVIQLAGHFVDKHQKEDIKPLVDSNILFGTHLLEAMKYAGIKNIINTSSYWEEYKQDGKYHPVNLYSAYKKAFQDILQYYVEVEKFRAITLKLYDVYGPFDYRKKIIPLLIECAKSGKALDLTPGNQYIDFIFISDVIEAYIKAIKYILADNISQNKSVDVGSGKPIQLRKLISLFQKIYNQEIKINFNAKQYRKREIMKAKAKINKTQKILGWQPSVSIEQGLIKIRSLKKND